MGEEHAHIALADGEGAAKLLLGKWTQDQSDDRRRNRIAKSPHQESDDTDQIEHQQIEGRIVERVDAERGEDENARIEQRPRDRQKPDP